MNCSEKLQKNRFYKSRSVKQVYKRVKKTTTTKMVPVIYFLFVSVLLLNPVLLLIELNVANYFLQTTDIIACCACLQT